ncbi:MAG: deoxyguanosinetriphosphate triphosphohydrolase [Aggregatilineales bacterium]
MSYSRQQIEQRERATLAPYACLSAESKGRLYRDTDDVYRTVFQRDHDRILHTAAFRRLEYKTQVFVNFEGDYYRTRLTHTLEVAQIGRSLARAIGVNEDLVEAICLAHDLGHPPFGHAGEDTLDRLTKDYGGFNHNWQTYRIVTEIEERYPNWPGLNLTDEVREGIARHITKVDFRAHAGFDPTLRGTVEAQIADLSDSLAYNAHDLDDGLRAGLFTHEQVEPLAIWQRVKDSIDWSRAAVDDTIRYRIIRRLVSLHITDVIEMTDARLKETKPDSPDAIRRLSFNVVGYSAQVAALNAELRNFLTTHLYEHYRVVRMQQRAARFITDLFESFVAAPEQLPPDTYRHVAARGLHRTVADYIAGMTDRYALDEWQRLFDPFTRP